MKIGIITYNAYICIQWSTLKGSGLNNCDAYMDILIYRNEFLKIIFTMLKQRSKNRNKTNNRTFKISYIMNVFEFVEVQCMGSRIVNWDGSVDVSYWTSFYLQPHLQYLCQGSRNHRNNYSGGFQLGFTFSSKIFECEEVLMHILECIVVIDLW